MQKLGIVHPCCNNSSMAESFPEKLSCCWNEQFCLKAYGLEGGGGGSDNSRIRKGSVNFILEPAQCQSSFHAL